MGACVSRIRKRSNAAATNRAAADGSSDALPLSTFAGRRGNGHRTVARRIVNTIANERFSSRSSNNESPVFRGGFDNHEDGLLDSARLRTNYVVPYYSLRRRRLRSFRDWPHDPRCGPRISDLIDSGFYYTRYSDVVRCYCCGILVADWYNARAIRQGTAAAHTSPYRRHYTLNPHCLIARRMYALYTAMVQRNDDANGGAINDAATNVAQTSTTTTTTFSSRTLMTTDRAVEATSGAPMTTSQTATPTSSLGESRDRVRRRLTYGEESPEGDYVEVAEETLAHPLSSSPPVLPPRRRDLERSSSAVPVPEPRQSTTNTASTATITSTVAPAAATPSADANTTSYSSTDGSAVDTEAFVYDQCVVCLDYSTNVCFWPCRHAVCCKKCAFSLDHCPVCRANCVAIFALKYVSVTAPLRSEIIYV